MIRQLNHPRGILRHSTRSAVCAIHRLRLLIGLGAQQGKHYYAHPFFAIRTNSTSIRHYRLEPLDHSPEPPIDAQIRPKSDTKVSSLMHSTSSKIVLNPLPNRPKPPDYVWQSNEQISDPNQSVSSSNPSVAPSHSSLQGASSCSSRLFIEEKISTESSANKSKLTKRTASILIQKKFRGHFVRKNFDKISFLDYLERRQFAYDFVDSLIDEYLEDEIIPDLLIYSIKELDGNNLGLDKDEYQVGDIVYKEKDFPLIKVVEEMIFRDFLPLFTREVVGLTTEDMIKGYFIDRLKDRKDPYQQIADLFLEEEIEFLVGDLVRNTIDDMVQEYLRDAKMYGWLTNMINESLNEWLRDIAEECIQELSYTWLIEELVEEEISLFAQVIVEDSVRELDR